MMRMRWIRWVASALVLAIAGLVTFSVSSGTEVATRPERSIPGVRVEMAERGASKSQVQLSGIVRARNRATVAFETAGRLVSRTVDVGDRFSAGQLLARLDQRELELAVSAAAAALAEIDARLAQEERDLRRTTRLVEEGVLARREAESAAAVVDALRALRDAAKARLEETRRELGETTLLAPFAGTVVSVSLEPGEYAQPGQAVLELSGSGPLEVELEVPETLLRYLTVQSDVVVRLPLLDQTLSGRVLSVGDASIGPGRLFPVVVGLDGGPLVRAGVTAEVAIEVSDSEMWLVPLAAVSNPGGGQPSVMRLVEGRVERLPVQVGSLSGDRVAVRGPLTSDDRVIVSGQASLSDGDRAEVR